MSDTGGDDDFLSVSQMKAEAYVPKVAAALSMLGSSVIIYELFLDYHLGRVRDKPTSRMLLSLSIADMIFSFGWFLTTWPAPSDLDYIWGNVGNAATCTFQGFLIQLGFVSSPLFSVMLALFFLLRIRYGWTDDRLRRLEPWIHGGVWTFGLAAAIYPLFLGLYNNVWQICWLESYPMGCLDSAFYGKDANCTRGDNASIHALVFAVFPAWLCVAVDTVFMAMIYWTVRRMESRNSRYAGALQSSVTTDPRRSSQVTMDPRRSSQATMDPRRSSQIAITRSVNRRRSRQVATQALLYITAFLLCYTLDLVVSVTYYVHEYWNFWLDIFAYFLLPLQGFYNFLIFMRARKMKSCVGKALRAFFCCLEGKTLCCLEGKTLKGKGGIVGSSMAKSKTKSSTEPETSTREPETIRNVSFGEDNSEQTSNKCHGASGTDSVKGPNENDETDLEAAAATSDESNNTKIVEIMEMTSGISNVAQQDTHHDVEIHSKVDASNLPVTMVEEVVPNMDMTYEGDKIIASDQAANS